MKWIDTPSSCPLSNATMARPPAATQNEKEVGMHEHAGPWRQVPSTFFA
jgi:hypothetical protein